MKATHTYILGCLTIMLVTSFTNKKVSRPYFHVPFTINETNLTDSARALLDNFYNKTIAFKEEKTGETFYEKYKVLITLETCEEEFKTDSLIGYKRALTLINYMCNTHKLSKDNFILSGQYDNIVPGRCINTGLELNVSKR